MTSRWSRFSRALALWLLLLGVSPFTAPFSTCSPTGQERQHGLPFEGSVHKDLFSKLDAASDMAIALGAGTPAWPPALNAVGVNPVPEFQRDDHRRVLHSVLRV